MSLNDKYAYIVLSKYFRFLVIPKNKGIINKNNFFKEYDDYISFNTFFMEIILLISNHDNIIFILLAFINYFNNNKNEKCGNES